VVKTTMLFYAVAPCRFIRRLIKISVTEFIVGKRKHLQVTRSYYLLQSTTLQIVCNDSSDPSTFQRMSGVLVLEWPATAVSCLFVSPRRLEIFSPSGCSSVWGRERSSRGPNVVSKVGGGTMGMLCLAKSSFSFKILSRIFLIRPRR
jgi:hypothetical protein